MILLIDNYDSFTYNLVQYLGELGAEVEVVRNDAITVDAIAALAAEGHRHLARARHAERGRHLERRDPRASRGKRADPRRLPRPPVHGAGLGGDGRARAAHHARQDLADLPRRARALRRARRTRSTPRATTR